MCEECGQDFEKKSWNTRFCSTRCGQRNWRNKNREHVNAQWRAQYAKDGYAKHIARKYNVSVEWFEEHAANGCEVCGRTERLVVDHSHETGEARGVLCNWCNVALGHAQDNAETLRRIADYVERHN